MKSLTLEQWMKQEGYYTYEEIKERVFVNGGNESDLDAEMEPIRMKYDDYIEELTEAEDDGES